MIRYRDFSHIRNRGQKKIDADRLAWIFYIGDGGGERMVQPEPRGNGVERPLPGVPPLLEMPSKP